MDLELFDDVLNLEEQYHQEGYDAGVADGAEAGKIEGKSVGLKQGFDKFLEAGRLQGKAIVWANRIPRIQQQQQQQRDPQSSHRLPPLATNPRLEKNVVTLYGLVEPGTLSTDNDDEAVNDVDSRVKGAHSKVKIIERATGERLDTDESRPSGVKSDNIEDIGRIPQRPGESESKG